MYTPQLPLCGRPGRTGNPCKSPRLSGRPACGIHMSEHELQLYAAFQAGRAEMAREMSGEYARGFESGRLAAQKEIASTYPSRPSQRSRADRRGEQYVTCGDRAYLWRGPGQLRPGDTVAVPGPLPGSHRVAVVTALGSTSIGLHPYIIGRVPDGGGVVA